MSSGTKRHRVSLNPALLFEVSLLILLMTSCQVPDYIYYNLADINDYRNFPSVTITASADPLTLNRSRREPDLFIRDPMKEMADTMSLTSFLSDTRTASFMIIRKDSVVYEHYFSCLLTFLIHSNPVTA